MKPLHQPTPPQKSTLPPRNLTTQICYRIISQRLHNTLAFRPTIPLTATQRMSTLSAPSKRSSLKTWTACFVKWSKSSIRMKITRVKCYPSLSNSKMQSKPLSSWSTRRRRSLSNTLNSCLPFRSGSQVNSNSYWRNFKSKSQSRAKRKEKRTRDSADSNSRSSSSSG